MDYLPNLILAFTNFTGLIVLPHLSDWKWYLVLSTIFASFFFHLFESHKHGLPGFIIHNHQISYFLINVDRFFANLSILVFGYYYRSNINIRFIVLGCIAVAIMAFSETILLPAKYKVLYTIIHSIWHIMAFGLLYLLVSGSKN